MKDNMYGVLIEENLQRILRKLFKKDKARYELVMKKISSITLNHYHYKPLRYDLKNIRADHVGSFVIAYRIDEGEKIVKFLDFDHHDKIYKKRFEEE